MLHPVYIYPGDVKTAHGIAFPGCHSAADGWEDIPAMLHKPLKRALLASLHRLCLLPAICKACKKAGSTKVACGCWLILTWANSNPPLALEHRPAPAHLLKQIDSYADKKGMRRSGFLAKAAEQATS